MHGLSQHQIEAIRIRVKGNAGRRPDQRVPNPVKHGFPGRKHEQRFQSRSRDYTAMMDNPSNRGKDYSGYHRPGSMQRFS